MPAKLSKNQEILLLVMQQCGRQLGRTRLQKTLFLADYEARRRLGRPISGYEYKFRRHGPYTGQIPEDVRSLEALDVAKEHSRLGWRGVFYYYSMPRPVEVSQLSAAETLICAAAAQKCSQGDLDELLREIYQTAPMKWAQERGRGVRIPMEMFDAETSVDTGLSRERIERSERELDAGKGIAFGIALDELRRRHFADRAPGPF